MKKTRDTLLLTLPDELIVQILWRLPVRSLLRFKCVCKSWFSLISDRQFVKSHIDLAAAPTHRLLVKFSNRSQVNSVDIEAPLHDDSSQVVFNIPLPLPAPKYGCKVCIVGPCRGFVLLTNKYMVKIDACLDFFDFVVWNPSTGVHKRINNVSMYAHLCGIGYVSSTDDYVVVNVTLRQPGGRFCTEVHCFSLRTNSWSHIEDAVPYFYLGSEFRHGLLLNGALHWLVESTDTRHLIIAFDAMERRLSEIRLPHDLAIRLECSMSHLWLTEGRLCISFRGYGTTITEIWTMKEYRVQSSWTKSCVLSPYGPLWRVFYPMCFTKNGEILGSNGRSTLVRFNDKGDLLEHCSHGPETSRFSLLNCGTYRESLLSLPGEFEEAIEDEQQE
ncbi:F-box protein CPR30 [Spatholobus suberectus]|nr:F-box protein CPR30 [Spatholobus suberectus]